jgi:hypothetical protein
MGMQDLDLTPVWFRLSVDAVRLLYEAIRDGGVSLIVIGETPKEVYAGQVVFGVVGGRREFCGWVLQVFWDGGEFDYVSMVMDRNGHRLTFDDMARTFDEATGSVQISYRPEELCSYFTGLVSVPVVARVGGGGYGNAVEWGAAGGRGTSSRGG